MRLFEVNDLHSTDADARVHIWPGSPTTFSAADIKLVASDGMQRCRSSPMPSPALKLPPGPSFILCQLFSLEFVAYAASVYVVRVVALGLNLNVPWWETIACSILVLPCFLLAQAQYRYWKDRRTAASLGARLAPTVPMRLPGGIDLITAWMEAFRTGYIGEKSTPNSFPKTHCNIFR